jgi:hypothetical protein
MIRIIVVLFFFLVSCIEKNQEEFQLQKGDLLFQDLDSSPLCDAIEIVTPGYKNGSFSHIGIVVETETPFCINGRLSFHKRILEAIPNKVKTTSVDSFLNRSFDKNDKPKVIVGRLKKEYQHLIEDAILFMKSKLGMEYDNVFLANNNKYYCSELIYEAFKEDTIFKLHPMTFLHPENNDTLDIWRDYYSKLKMEIPEKKLGINPGIMSISDKIDIVHVYGIPDGMQE